ncbi:ATP-binding protein [Aliiruegeria sabulilitoris]|uniref:ATP-binding protein n=1 Tax=Aliiruegeria sabulilitoris TaxID=1510458 RepID=UPI00082B074C|nr:ATP-binding protein [Aliiruegeria sabulilitoris]NDR55427.1 response regulator [Pseudoruegeria sp. M32A2M]
MLVFLTQSLIALALVGVLFFPLFTKPRRSELDWNSAFLMGFVFGFAAALALLSGFKLEGGFIISCVAGALIFAGYLGGALTAAIALLFTLGLRIWFGGALLPVSIGMLIGLAVVGCVLRRIAAQTDRPRFSPRILAYAMGGYVVVETGFVVVAALFDLLPPNPVPLLVARYCAGIVSVTLAWLFLRISWNQSSLMRENSVLLRQMQLVFETCGIGVFRYNGETKRLSYDTSFLHLYGVQPSDGLHPGTFAKTQVHPDDQAGMQAYIMEATMGHAEQGSHFFRARRPDGQFHHMRSSWKLEGINPDGSRNVIGLHIDVSDVVEAQQRQAKAEHQVAAIAENVPGVIFQIVWREGAASQLTYVSPKATEIWGKSPEELIADPYSTVTQYDDGELPKIVEAISQAAETGKPAGVRVRLRDVEERPLVFKIRVQAAPLGDGSYLVNGICLDVTREARAEARAHENEEIAHRAQKNESIGRLTGGMAHDFNNLLAVILGNLELIRENPGAEDKSAMIDAAIRACNRGAELTRSMLSFARKARLSPVTLDLNAVVRDSGNWMRRALPDSVEMETSLLAGLWQVKLDPSSFENALLNLIINARDAMNGHGRLTIETANMRIDREYIDARQERLPPGRYVMLAVSDNGEGMDQETLQRSFEPFFTTKAPGTGSGIGLSMVLGFVRQSGGTVQVYTEPGEGTTFKLYFPAVSGDGELDRNATAKEYRAGEAQSVGTPYRILLVEDDDEIRKVMMTRLRNSGYAVTDAASGDAAFECFKADPSFDVIVTDIVMPGTLQGPRLAAAIREIDPSARFVFMTGYASEAAVHGNGLRPEDIRLMKPFPQAELLEAIAVSLKTVRHEGDD